MSSKISQKFVDVTYGSPLSYLGGSLRYGRRPPVEPDLRLRGEDAQPAVGGERGRGRGRRHQHHRGRRRSAQVARPPEKQKGTASIFLSDAVRNLDKCHSME